MALDRLTKITGPGIATDTNWVGNNADFTGITTTATSFNIGVTTVHSTLIEAHNIKSTGIITATGAHFSGNVSIGGTLSYEDVTNIDSVGLVTAREGIFVPNSKEVRIGGSSSSGLLRLFSNGTHQYIRDSGSGNLYIATNSLNVLNGVTSQTLLKANQGSSGYVKLYQNNQVKLETTPKGIVVGTGVTIETNGQAEIAGITTFYKDVHIKTSTGRLYLGANDRLSLIADPSHSYLRINGGHFQIHNNNFGVRSYDGNGSITLFYSPLTDGNEGGGPRLYHYHGGGSAYTYERLRTTKSGVKITGVTTTTGLAVTGVSTFTGAIVANNHIELASGKKLSMASDVFKIYHSTNAAIINESGDLLINQNVSNKDIKISTGSGPTERLRIKNDGKVIIGNTSGSDPSSTVAGAMFYGGSYPGDFRISSGAGASGTTTGAISIMGSNYHASLTHGNNYGAQLSLYNYNTTDGNSTAVSFLNSNGLAIARVLGHIQSHSSRLGNLVFMTSDGTHPVEKARLTHDGRFGIGDDNPDYMLQLKGAIPAIALEDTSGTHGFSVIEQNDDNLKIRCDAPNQSSGTGSNIRFEVDGTEKLRIPSTGGIELKIDGKGIQFPTPQTPYHASSNRVGISSEMRYYETGTLTPGLSSTVLNGLQIATFTDGSYARRVNRYVRVGHIVHCFIEIKMASSVTYNAGSTSTAPVCITGTCPFKWAYSGRYDVSGEPDYIPCSISYSSSGLTNDSVYAVLTRDYNAQPRIDITRVGSGGSRQYNSVNFGMVFPANASIAVAYSYPIDLDNADY